MEKKSSVHDHYIPTVYIRCSIPTLVKRIHKRNRAEESNLDVGFLRSLQQRHEDWLFYKNSSFPLPTDNVKTLDGEMELEQFQDYLNKHQESIFGGR